MAKFAQRFVLEREIGAGGMAQVFLGRDEILDRPVAVKILNPRHGGTEIGDRFRREGRTAARLSHPNIVQVYDAGEDELDGREVSYIVMEYVSGGDLKGLIDEKGPLPNDELAKLGAEVSSGLAHAHERGVVHRDIKPHNILIDSSGRPKLSDFGIARALDATPATRTGSYLGTALYSSPEQLRGEKVTPKSDVYSLGIALYQAAVGKVPFTGTPIEVASQHVSRAPTAPSTLGADLSDEVEALILDCIQKDPDLRPTAEEIHERLQEEAGSPRSTLAYAAPPVAESSPAEHTRTAPAEATPAGPPPGAATREGHQRRGPILAAVVLLLVLLGVGAAFAMLGSGSLDLVQAPQEEKNQQESSPEDSGGQAAQSAGGGEESVSEQTGQQASSGNDQGSSDEETAATQAVEDFYASAAEGDYNSSSNLLTSDWLRSTFPTRAVFEGTFGTLQSVRFVERPTVTISGNTATVAGETEAQHTDRTERNRGTWRLVNRNGEWIISGWDVTNISSTEPA